MEELAPGVGVGHHGQEVLKFGAAVADNVANGILHEAVGDDDPYGGKVGGKRHGPDGEAMYLFAYPIPAEGPHRNECGFQKKGSRGLNGQKRAENVADIGGVF